MGDIAHHYIIYNMRFWRVRRNFRHRGEWLRKPQNLHFLYVERRKTAKIKKKCTFFALFCRNILLVLKKAITLHSLFRGNTPTRKARSLKCCSFLTSSTREQDGTSVPSVPERQVQHKGENESSAGPGREINLGVCVFKTLFPRRSKNKIHNNEEFDPGSG